MKISLEHISKKFQKHWVFREVSLSFESPGIYALLGHNGSGKSTLMRIIGGMQMPSRGKVAYEYNGSPYTAASIYTFISYSAPGMELIEEMTLKEFLDFHFSFKKALHHFPVEKLIALSGLQKHGDTLIGEYSSGMKQRVKLLQAFFSDTPVLLLDEPCTNLDQQGILQYRTWIREYTKERLVIIASNDPSEYEGCSQIISLEDYA